MSAVVNLADRRGQPTAAPAIDPADRILRLKAVIDRVGLSRATLYRRIADNAFPAPVSLGGTSVGWRESAVNAWIAALGKGGAA